MRTLIAGAGAAVLLGVGSQALDARASDAPTEPTITPGRMSDEALARYEALDHAVRAADEALTFRLMNLTGIVFRMYFCRGAQVAGAAVLDRILAQASRPAAQVELFRAWYAAELQFNGNSIAVWRETGAVGAMQKIECSARRLEESREWFAQNGGSRADIRR